MALTVASEALARDDDPAGGQDWLMIGHDPAGSHNNRFEQLVGPSNVSRLAPKWVATTAGDVSATPVVADGAAYFPDWGGMLWKLDAETGQVIWSHSISEYDGIADDVSRTSPALASGVLFIGDNLAGYMMAIDAETGALRWITLAHPDPAAISTGSPVVIDGRVYMAYSSRESAYDQAQGIECCRFRSALVALDALTGRVAWRTYVLPDNHAAADQFSGATSFAPPAVNPTAGLVYATFDETYTKPASVTACLDAAPDAFSEDCIPPRTYFKSLVAFDVRTGEPRWSYRIQGHDAWVRACGGLPASVTWCAPESDLLSWDFSGSEPNAFQTQVDGVERDVVGVGEKSGMYLVVDARTGEFLWNTLVGPGAEQGGIQWGTATDGDRIYVTVGNANHVPFNLTPSGARGHRWLLGSTRPGDRTDPLADRRPAGFPRLLPRHGRERRRLRVVDGQDWKPDVRARRQHGRDPLAVRRRQLSQRRPGSCRWDGLLGLWLQPARGQRQ